MIKGQSTLPTYFAGSLQGAIHHGVRFVLVEALAQQPRVLNDFHHHSASDVAFHFIHRPGQENVQQLARPQPLHAHVHQVFLL